MKKFRTFKKHARSLVVTAEKTTVHYEKLDRDSGQRINWSEEIDPIPVQIEQTREFTFSFQCLYFDGYEMDILEKVKKFSIYPVTNDHTLKEKHGEAFDVSLARQSLIADFGNDSRLMLDTYYLNKPTVQRRQREMV